jgi:DNA-binding CsgD family transcriptional regulator
MNTNRHQVNKEAVSQRGPASKAVVILSPREKQLLRRLAQGKSDHKIAAEIGGTAQQIVGQRQRLIEKLAIKSQAELAAAVAQLAPWPPGGRKHSG